MILDIFTLRVATGAVVLVTGALFLVQSWSRRGAAVDRLWMLALSSALMAAVVTAAQETAVPNMWWLGAIGNAATVLVPWAVWSGARVGVGEPARIWLGGLVGLVTAVAVLARGPDGGTWAGGAVFLAAVTLGSVAGGWEVLRGPLRRYRSGIGLAVILLTTGVFYAVRFLLFLAVGPDHRLFTTVVGTELASLVLVVLVNGAALFMVALRGDQGVAERPGSARYDPLTGARPAGHFASMAQRVIGDSAQRGLPACVVRVRLDDAPAIRTAFGESRIDEAYAVCGDVLQAVSPPGTLVGLEEDGTGFQVVLHDATTGDGERWAEKLRAELLNAPVRLPDMQFLLVLSVGVACTVDHGHDLAALRSAAGDALEDAQRAGGDQVRSVAQLD